MQRIIEKLDKKEIEKIRKSNLPMFIFLSLIVSLAVVPLIKENSSMKESLLLQQKELKNYQEYNIKYGKSNNLQEMQNKSLEYLDMELPGLSGKNKIIEEYHKLIAKENLNIKRINAEVAKYNPNINVIVVHMSVGGDYSQIKNFLKNVENRKQKTKIKNLRLRQINDGEVVLTADCHNYFMASDGRKKI